MTTSSLSSKWLTEHCADDLQSPVSNRQGPCCAVGPRIVKAWRHHRNWSGARGPLVLTFYRLAAPLSLSPRVSQPTSVPSILWVAGGGIVIRVTYRPVR